MISVVMCVRNAASTFQGALEALAAQTCAIDWELIVVDNGSTDATLNILDRAQPHLPTTRVIDAHHAKGLAHARNIGYRAARADFVAFCDADDEVDRGWVAAMVQVARDAHVVGGLLDRDKLNDAAWLTPERRRSAGLVPWPGFLPRPPGANCGIQTRVLDELGGFDETYLRGAEDTHLFWRAQLAGFQVQFAPEAVVHYRERPRLRDIARQFYGYGTQDPHLFRDFRDHGMPASGWLTGMRSWAHLVVLAPRYWRSPAGRRAWVRASARRVGRAVGSVRWRSCYL